MQIFGAATRYEKLMWSSLETCTMLGVVNIRARLSVRAARRRAACVRLEAGDRRSLPSVGALRGFRAVYLGREEVGSGLTDA